MARSKINPTTSVTFRMPESVLEIIDQFAAQKNHDRTAEINDSCRHWMEIGGCIGNESITQRKIADLQAEILTLNEHLEKQSAILSNLSGSIINLEKNNTALLSVISSNEQTIKHLLDTLSKYILK